MPTWISMTDSETTTTRDLAKRLHVPMPAVIKVLMAMGVIRTARHPLTAEEVALATRLIETEPERFAGGPPPRDPPSRRRPRRPPRGSSGGPPVREPRSPSPGDRSSGAVAAEEDTE
jgi:hypothetical protein